MARECRLDRAPRGLAVADLAHQNDVGFLAPRRSGSRRKRLTPIAAGSVTGRCLVSGTRRILDFVTILRPGSLAATRPRPGVVVLPLPVGPATRPCRGVFRKAFRAAHDRTPKALLGQVDEGAFALAGMRVNQRLPCREAKSGHAKLDLPLADLKPACRHPAACAVRQCHAARTLSPRDDGLPDYRGRWAGIALEPRRRCEIAGTRRPRIGFDIECRLACRSARGRQHLVDRQPPRLRHCPDRQPSHRILSGALRLSLYLCRLSLSIFSGWPDIRKREDADALYSPFETPAAPRWVLRLHG